MVSRVLRVVLIVLNAFLAFTAAAGGVGLLAGFGAPPADMLAGSPFRSFAVPGLALMVIVGGTAFAAAILLARRQPGGVPVSVAAGLVIIVFEIVEIAVIGSPAGAARAMQVFYLALGLLTLIISAILWLQQRRKAV